MYTVIDMGMSVLGLYNFAAGGFLSKKLCSRLHSIEVDFYSKKGKVRFLSHHLGALIRGKILT